MTRRSLVQLAKDAKHAQLVARRRLPEVPGIVRDRTYRTMDRIRPYRYASSDFPDSFVSLEPKATTAESERPFPMRIFVVWAGDNPLTPNRAEALDEIHAYSEGVEVVLITPFNLSEWLVPAAPLHSAYPHLSLNHRSDYLRAYLMHHHGGVYLDVKKGYRGIRGAMERFAAMPDKWVMGYREIGADAVGDGPETIYRALRRHHGMLIGTPAFAARPGTPLTSEWCAEIERRMDRWAPALAKAPGNTFGSNDGYPVPWIAVQGATFQPLCLKYAERVSVDERLKPSFENYR